MHHPPGCVERSEVPITQATDGPFQDEPRKKASADIWIKIDSVGA